ncbi:GIP, partial [Symbiodinium sp. KB8]
MFNRRLRVAMMNQPLRSVCPREVSDTIVRVMSGNGTTTLKVVRGGTPGLNGEVGPGLDPGTEAVRSEELAGLRAATTTALRPPRDKGIHGAALTMATDMEAIVVHTAEICALTEPISKEYGTIPGRMGSNAGAANPVWSGWRHFAPANNGLHNDAYEGASQKGTNPRPSEKLSVPVFNGGDEEDVGTSARSYLRQVEAWRRLTYLPPNQQGLVLYRHLAGKAWVAAEELNVDALSRDDGVHYLMSWLRNRYLDLEVTRIGKALSEMFRRLRRKPGQSIRDYNAEYDRLHARLKEVGCMLPEECAAWLYVDRLQLEEGAELNLLASVGNTYSLGKLQKAAIIQDRGLRKPWESGNGKGGRKPYTAHVTDSGDHDDEGDLCEEPCEDDEAIPEEVAVAYMTYQSAKNKYKEFAKTRGYKGDSKGQDASGGAPRGSETGPSGAKIRDEKLKQIKARSFCSGCGRRGHWHKDDECPNNAGHRDGGAGKAANAPKEICVTMPAEVMTMKHIAGNLLGITDTACARTVAGTQWLQDYMDRIGDNGAQPELSKECEAYKFGTGRIHYSSFSVVLSFSLGDKVVQLRASIIPGDIPLLLSKTVLGKLGMIYDVSDGCADFTQVGLKGYKLLSTASGHPAIPIVPAKPAGGVRSVLSIEDLSLEPRAQYMVHAVAFAGHSSQPLYNLYYEKKLPPEVKVMLSQTQLCRESFISWWNQCEERHIMSVVDAAAMGRENCSEQEECVRLGLTVHRTWSPEEIKSVIMEHREARKDSDATEKMKRISQLTLEELKEKAKELSVEYPARITKGNLLRLVRDSLNTPDNELMKIGKHRGLEFREIPWQYGQWASNEVKVSKNADPELVRFARWWDQNEENKKNRGYMKDDYDEMSKRPMPPASEPGTSTSWETVSHAWETSWPTHPPLEASRTTRRDPAQLPFTPETAKATNTKRRTHDAKSEAMDDEVDEETAEEIKKLELRLALLKDKAGNGCCDGNYDVDLVIVDEDLERALRDQHVVLSVNPELTVGDRRDLPPGERLAKAAYDRADYTYATLKEILEAADLKPRRNDR